MRLLFFISSLSILPILPVCAASYSVSQKDCTSTDIRDTNPKIRNNQALRAHFSKPRNQDTVGWCFAFVASDLISAEIGIPISAFHTSAINNNKKYQNYVSRVKEFAEKLTEKFTGKITFEEIYSGGWIEDAVKNVADNGWVCTEKGLPFDAEQPENIKQMLHELERLKSKSEELSKEQLCTELQKTLTPFSPREMTKIAESLVHENLNQTLNTFAHNTCSQKIDNVPKMNVVVKEKPHLTRSGQGVRDYMASINSLLNQGKPIGMAYSTIPFSTSGGHHASIITGRRWKNGKCEFKIRNTWGQSCSSYLKNIECNKAEGSFWISDGDLYSSSKEIKYISN